MLVGVADIASAEQLRSLVDGFVCVDAPPFKGGELAAFDADPFRRAVDRVTHQLRPAVVIAEYVWLAPALARVPRFVRRIVDCHDVFHERTERFEAANLDPWVRTNRLEETRLLSAADVILATQDREAGLLRRMLPHARVASILTPIDLPPDFIPLHADGHIVLTVGANHPGNGAVVDFARGFWPRVFHHVPSARLQVVGGIASSVPPLHAVDRVGQVAELAPYYASAAVVVCPVSTGTGVKTKLLEAVRFGKATVATTAASEGIPQGAPPAWVTAPTLADVADATIDLLLTPVTRATLERRAFKFGTDHVSQCTFARQLNGILPNALSRCLTSVLV